MGSGARSAYNPAVRAARADASTTRENAMTKRMLAAICVVAAIGCGPSKDEFAAVQRDSQQNLKKYQDEGEKTQALEKKVADLQQQLDAANANAAKLQEEKGQLEAKSAQYQQLAGSLQSQIANGQVEISELKGRMTVKLKDQVLFTSASAKLNDDGKKALDAVAEAFKDLKGKNVVVAGFTDNVPLSPKSGFPDNWALSAARAVNVVRYLQSKGVTPAMLGAAGFSEYRPVAPNDSAQNRSLNRRIEIALTAADPVPVVEAAK
jgi:chemotaxis protein MotB